LANGRKYFRELECGLVPNVMAALPNIGVAACESPVIPFLNHAANWLTPLLKYRAVMLSI